MILEGIQAVVAGQLGFSAATVPALLDPGATGNFIDQEYVSFELIQMTHYSQPRQLTLLNRSPTSSGPIKEFIEEEISVAGVKGRAKFDVTRLSGLSLVLGYSWLKEQRVVLDFS